MRNRGAIIVCVVMIALICLSVVASAQTAEEWYKKGKEYSAFGVFDHEKAIECYSKAIALNPNYGDALYARGLEYYFLDRYNEAIADYTKVINLGPKYKDYGYVYKSRGGIYYELGRYSEAIADYTKAEGLVRPDGHLYYERGDSYYKLGNTEKALPDFKKSCEDGMNNGCEKYNALNPSGAEDLPEHPIGFVPLGPSPY